MTDILDRAAAIVEQATPGRIIAEDVTGDLTDDDKEYCDEDSSEAQRCSDPTECCGHSPRRYWWLRGGVTYAEYGEWNYFTEADAKRFALAPSLGAALALAKAVRDYREGWCLWATVADAYEAFVASLAESIKED